MPNDDYILTASEMRAAEQELIDSGVSVEELMQRAGEGAAEQIWRVSGNPSTVVVCGPGNNGGDGYVIAEWLRKKGVETIVASVGEPKTDAARNAAGQWQGSTIALEDAKPASQFVDCVFGTGLKRPVDEEILGHLERQKEAAKRTIAVDLPSGIETDSGGALNEISPVQMTIALGAYKPAHFFEPARSLMGDLVGVDIGINTKSDTRLIRRPVLKTPQSDDHKYSRGLVAVVAGEMPGAANLTAMAAQRSGAGYVKIFAPQEHKSPEQSIVVKSFDDTATMKEGLSDPRISMVVIGPGLGRDKQAGDMLEAALGSNKPLLLDADALWLLGDGFTARLSELSQPVIATPHHGEFQQICKVEVDSKIERSRQLARSANCTVLFKGPDTVISHSDNRAYASKASNSWLSTAGTGDVLAGIIAARFAVEKDALLASQQGQWLHTRAAQLAGPAFAPEQLIAKLPTAIGECL